MGTREAADRLCLWCFCRRDACQRARGCRGDPHVCVGVLRVWLEALAGAMHAAPADPGVRLTLTREESRTLAVWREAVEQADVKPFPVSQEDADRMRMDLARKIEALRKQEAWEAANS